MISDNNVAWPERFKENASALSGALGQRAMRIYHIGSTSVPGLAAKDVKDLQVSVADFEPFETLRSAIESLGYEWMPDHRKRFFHRDSPQGMRLPNLHVRRLGEYSEQAALLFRDCLRARPEARHRYEETKRAPWQPGPGPQSTTTQTRKATV